MNSVRVPVLIILMLLSLWGGFIIGQSTTEDDKAKLVKEKAQLESQISTLTSANERISGNYNTVIKQYDDLTKQYDTLYTAASNYVSTSRYVYTSPSSISCTSSQLGSFTYTNCY